MICRELPNLHVECDGFSSDNVECRDDMGGSSPSWAENCIIKAIVFLSDRLYGGAKSIVIMILDGKRLN